MGNRAVSALFVGATLLVGGEAWADVIDDLEPGNWSAIPDTKMRDVCPPDVDGGYEYSFYCDGVIGAWGGAALDTTRGQLILWGGGHGDYKGNEVYTFDLITLEWARPWGPTPDGQIPSGGAHDAYDDGNPGSRHTYSGLVYVPEPYDAMYSFGGSLWQSGSRSSSVWSFSIADNAWTLAAAGASSEQSYGDPTIFDPQTGLIFHRANSGMYTYDPASDGYEARAASDGGFWNSNVAVDWDPDARIMLIIGEGQVDTYDLDADVYTYDVAVVGAGAEELFGGSSPGVAFDPEQSRFVVYGGGLDVYTYDVDEATFSLHENAGDDPGSIGASGGAFTRFRYAPSRNVFVWVNDVDQDVHVLRMTDGPGTPPPGPGDTDTGGSSDTGDDDDTGGTAGPGPGSDTSGPPPATSGGDATSGDPETSAGSSGSAAGSDSEDGGGCGCKTGTAPPILFLGLLLLWRRRNPR